MPHTPTSEQASIIEAACSTKDNLILSALAGAAKTSTLEMVCQALPVQPILSLAFNKRIAEEMTKRLPGHVKCQTLNSIGHRVWQGTCSKKLILNTKKNYEILKGLIDEIPKRGERQEAYDQFSVLLKQIARAKLSGYIPEGKFPNAKRLTDTINPVSSGFIDESDEPETDFTWLIDAALTESIKQAYQGVIDFDDQIYMSTLFGGSFPRFPLVMVDEAQDLSALNHAMLDKLVTQRFIAVGDPYQSIYGFRGAVASGMSRLANTFSMVERPLSISFRCPIEVVKLARKRAPHMQYPEWAKPGQVNRLEYWNAESIPANAAIICRNNAPLFSLALRLLRAGRGVQLVGMDIGPALVRAMKKLGPESMSQTELIDAIDRWEIESLRKAKSKAAISDKAECLRVFASWGDTLAAAVAHAEYLFKSTGTIQLLSGHKSKGLEWDTVYHLDPHRIPSQYSSTEEELEQEKNLEYVITTRAKDTLNFVTMEGFDNGTP